MTSSALWYLSRASGVASMVLLSTVVILGLVTAGHGARRPDRATIVMALHRGLSLGMGVFLVAHIVTAIADGYVDLTWLAVVVPFIAGYQPLLVGFGALAVDLMLAIGVTSALRHRLSERTWRGVHLFSYAMWPIALVHGFGMGTADEPLLRFITAACGVAVVTVGAWRLSSSYADRDRRRAVAAGAWS